MRTAKRQVVWRGSVIAQKAGNSKKKGGTQVRGSEVKTDFRQGKERDMKLQLGKKKGNLSLKEVGG